jgi:hypothetical protein
MKALKIALPVLAVLLLVLVWAAPIGPLPGFFIGGTPAEAPAQWPDTSEVHEIELRVPGSPPRVVIIWVVEHGGELHVVGSRESGWVSRIGAGAPVQLRLGDDTYALNATPVTEGWQEILQAYVDKYRPDYPDIVAGFPSLEEAEGQVAVFRLERS